MKFELTLEQYARLVRQELEFQLTRDCKVLLTTRSIDLNTEYSNIIIKFDNFNFNYCYNDLVWCYNNECPITEIVERILDLLRKEFVKILERK